MTKRPHCQTKVWRHAAMFPPRLDKSRGDALPLFFVEERLHPSHAVLSSYATSEPSTMYTPTGRSSSDTTSAAEPHAVEDGHRTGCARHPSDPARLTGIGSLIQPRRVTDHGQAAHR